MSTSTSLRKADHLELCARGDVGFRGKTTLLDEVHLVHDALPDLAWDDVELGCTLFGKRLRAPIVIAAMTGGTDEAWRVNRELAGIAQARGYAFGLGSQRPMVNDASTSVSFAVRDVAPGLLLFGNIGVVQARDMSTEALRALVSAVSADALCVHMNPAMELVQPGGDRDFRSGLGTFERLVAELGVPVIAKETGCGISRSVARRLRSVGVAHVDVSGAGGTSWVGVETARANAAGDLGGRSLGERYWDWGIPTAASVAMVAAEGFSTVIATGGVTGGLDVARAIALGATVGGVARPVLKALYEGGAEAVDRFFDAVERELRVALLLTGSRDLAALRAAPRVVTGDLAAWIARGG